MNKIKIKGCGTALITPFCNGEVDIRCYRKLIKRQVEAKVDFLVPLGTTAETPCLSLEEKFSLLEVTKEEANGLPILVGCGSNSLKNTVDNIKNLSQYNPDAFLVVVPFYNKPTQEGMFQYFKAVAEQTEKPIVIYNVPGRTGVNMSFQTCLRLAEIPGIIGIKEASGNIEQILKIKSNAPSDFSVLCGNDDQTFPLMACGIDGVISVASNIVPELLVKLTAFLEKGNIQEAAELNKKLMPLYEACFVESNPIPIKGGMSLSGLCRNELRLPLTPATDTTLELFKKILETL